MFIYELAIEVGKHSSEVAEAARSLGVADAGPATELTRDQVAQLRTVLAGGSVPPPPPPPAGLVPPPPPPPTAPVAWAPTEPPLVSVVESAVAPPASPALAPPPPPPPPPPDTSGGGPVIDPDADEGFGRGQVVVVGVVAAAVVGLFGFMIINSGPDPERVEAIAAADPVDATDPGADGAEDPETSTTVPVEATTTVAAAPDAYAPLDLEAFCRGGRSFFEVTEGMSAAFITEDIAIMRAWVTDHRGDWDDALSAVAAGAPPINADDLMAFREMWDVAFDAINDHGSYESANDSLPALELTRANARFQQVAELIRFHCT